MAAACGPAAFDATDAVAIRGVLDRQVEAWNRGDLPGFVAGYWDSGALTFASGGNLERGFGPTLARYQRRYATREQMGQLRFEVVEIRGLAGEAALVIGRWTLAGERAATGLFSLVMRKTEGGWVVEHDHTSVDRSRAPAASD